MNVYFAIIRGFWVKGTGFSPYVNGYKQGRL
jgi:hypothetical protein